MLSHGDGKEEREEPDDAHPKSGIALASNAQGALSMDHSDVAVHRHGHQGEDANEHGGHDEIVHPLTEKGTKDPLWQGVNGGLEWDAEEKEGEVRNAQVEDEDVGGAAGWTSTWWEAAKYHEHQCVPHHAQ